MSKIENFYAVCKGLMFKGWLCTDYLENNSGNNANPSLINIKNFKVQPEQSIAFRHFLTQSLLEICYSADRVVLKYIHSGIQQNHGEGKRSMALLTQLCDEYNLDIELEVYASDKLPKTAKRLFNFYKMFGFELNKSRKDYIEVPDEELLCDDDFLYGIAMIRFPAKKLTLASVDGEVVNG